ISPLVRARGGSRATPFSPTASTPERTLDLATRLARHPLRVVEDTAQNAYFTLFQTRAQEQPAQALHDRDRRAALVEVDVVEHLCEVAEEMFQLIHIGKRFDFVCSRAWRLLQHRQAQFVSEQLHGLGEV